MRSVEHSVSVIRRSTPPPKSQQGMVWVWVVAALLVIGLIAFHFGTSHASDTNRTHAIRSGYAGACLDVQHSGKVNGTPIDTVDCNGTAAQDWTTTDTTIKQLNTNSCVSADSSGHIVLSTCADGANQVWLRDNQGYYNPDTGKCLSEAKAGDQVQLGSCDNMSWFGVTWLPGSAAQAPACSGSEGNMVACNAVKQWSSWAATDSNHESLLTTYTDGTPYEEWCADFVSYIYKQAGYPFTNGSADGWDENDANAIQNMGFTMHQAGDGYQPQPGDVAFFDYPGGHVEIVVSGGNKPTFVYGNSAQIDPTTGNGQMKANTVTQDDAGTIGQLEYYLSPNS